MGMRREMGIGEFGFLRDVLFESEEGGDRSIHGNLELFLDSLFLYLSIAQEEQCKKGTLIIKYGIINYVY